MDKGGLCPRPGNTSLRVPIGALAVNLASSRFCDNAGELGGGDVQSAAVRDDWLPFNIGVSGDV